MDGSSDCMLSNLINPEIKSLLAQKQYKALRVALCELEPMDIAAAISALSTSERAIVLRILPRDISTDVFEYLPLNEQEALLRCWGQTQISSILNEMEPDDRTALLEELPGQLTRRLLELLTPQERKIATTLLGYPEDSIGRLMTPEYVAIRADWTAEQTMQYIRQTAADKETINIVYVTDEKDRLLSYVTLRTIIFADPQAVIRDIMSSQVIALNAFDDQEKASAVMLKYDLTVLPVVNSEGTLVGIVTSDDIFDVVVEEATEDMHRMGGLGVVEEPYFYASMLTIVRKRLTWLFLLFLGGIGLASVMQLFQNEIQKLAVLSFFLPLVISSGGNSGSQASTLIIRSLAVQDIRLQDWLKVFLRELGSGLLLGLVLGLVIFMRIALFPTHQVAWVALASMLMLAVICVVTFGTLMGSMLPFILRALGFDPAFSSTPLIATLCDTVGVVIYFTLASLILAPYFS